MADLYEVDLTEEGQRQKLVYREVPDRRAWCEAKEGAYLLRTNLVDPDAARLWEQYVQLTEVEAVFRILKSEMLIRPIWHQKKDPCPVFLIYRQI